MSDILIKQIDAACKGDARLPNEPFSQWGRMIPHLENGEWSYTTEKLPEITELCFPNEPYDVEEDDAFFLGAYMGETCVGLVVLRRDMFRYLYLDDLKVNRTVRGHGIGSLLLEASMDVARELGLVGVYTIGQDNNLSACLFYLKNGFEIGGFNNRTYRGTSQENKADIYFYKDL